MIGRWWRRERQARYVLPPGLRAYAVGDVHGRADLLAPMLDWIREDSAARGGYPEVHVVFLGDLIDRGPGSAAVISMLASGRGAFGERHFIRGNHEQTLLDILDGDWARADDWLAVGGAETLLSYGVDPALFLRDPEAFRRAMRDSIPGLHVAFLRRMERWLRLGDYLFVHAGIRPRVALEEQSDRDLRWIRGDFLDSRVDHGMMVVHGHTISARAEFRANRIGIDTGAYASNRLTVLGLEEDRRWLLTSRLD
ncbi:metallophosphoesterase family protein [Sphingomonas sp. BK235]|uniref:metallophosphoesterase family protein n=1 Tax=Sphingomonas sp. BK235 TaxID=2512131 RepID=UPI00104E9168|nr:metallophosphoesterase family protein [Sphingomonas sp. BK235]TCP33075.1 serine/threonine protein phosphatase 1 [Sphingomonas sp. BK235]